jgi:hypothetical protein
MFNNRHFPEHFLDSSDLWKMEKYVRTWKPKKIDPNLKRELESGWLFPFLIGLDAMAWGRWTYWLNMHKHQKLMDWGIPPIKFGCGGSKAEGEGSFTRNHLENCLDLISGHGSWKSWSSQEYLLYFFDWLLFGFGYLKEEPKEPNGCKGASMRLYQYFDLAFLIAYPYDYWGGLFCEMNIGKAAGFYPTPHPIVDLMTDMVYGLDSRSDHRLDHVLDPCVGTGRMLLYASNHSLLLAGQDINFVCVRACLVNLYLYAPWGALPLSFFASEEIPEIPTPRTSLNNIVGTIGKINRHKEATERVLKLLNILQST